MRRSHTHDQGGNGKPGIEGSRERAERNAPSTRNENGGTKGTDLGAAYQTGVPVQTIGSQVTTTIYVDSGTPHLSIDSGDRNALPLGELDREGITVDPAGQ